MRRTHDEITLSPANVVFPHETLIEIVRQSGWVLAGCFARCSKQMLFALTRKEVLREIIESIKAREKPVLFAWLSFPLPSYLIPMEKEDIGGALILNTENCILAAEKGVDWMRGKLGLQDGPAIRRDGCFFTGSAIAARVYNRRPATSHTNELHIYDTCVESSGAPSISSFVRTQDECLGVFYKHILGADHTAMIGYVVEQQRFSYEQVGHTDGVFYQTPIAMYTYHWHDILYALEDQIFEVFDATRSDRVPQRGPIWTLAKNHTTIDDSHTEPFHQCIECRWHRARTLPDVSILNQWARHVDFHIAGYTDFTLSYCCRPSSSSSSSSSSSPSTK